MRLPRINRRRQIRWRWTLHGKSCRVSIARPLSISQWRINQPSSVNLAHSWFSQAARLDGLQHSHMTCTTQTMRLAMFCVRFKIHLITCAAIRSTAASKPAQVSCSSVGRCVMRLPAAVKWSVRVGSACGYWLPPSHVLRKRLAGALQRGGLAGELLPPLHDHVAVARVQLHQPRLAACLLARDQRAARAAE